ncbi:hypothetical protein RQP46_005746 [Phenoliferia psychrophenolica]
MSQPNAATRFIFLPHDILSEIFSCISSSYDWLKPASEPSDRNAVLSKLVLVSKAWRAAGTPILYRDLSLIWREQQVEWLLRTLIANPSLAAFPRRLSAALQSDTRPLCLEECERLLSTPWGEDRKKEERSKPHYLPEEEIDRLRREVEDRMDSDDYYYTSPHSYTHDEELLEELSNIYSSHNDYDTWSDSSFSKVFPEDGEDWPVDEAWQGEGGPDGEQAKLHIARIYEAYDIVSAQRETRREAFEEAKLARQAARREANIQKSIEEDLSDRFYMTLQSDTGFARDWVEGGGGAHALFRVVAKLSNLRDLAISDLEATYEQALASIPPYDYTQNPADVTAYIPPELPVDRAPREVGVGWHEDLERVLGGVQTFVADKSYHLGDILKRMTCLESLIANGHGSGVAVRQSFSALPALQRVRLTKGDLWNEGFRGVTEEEAAKAEADFLAAALEKGVDATVES